MKKGALKMEVCRMLNSVAKNIEDGSDYDSKDFKSLMSEACAYYDLYILKRDRKSLEAQMLEQKITPRYEEGLRTRIREYLDEF